MASVERTVTTSTPLERVWDYMTEFRNTEEWDPPTVRTVRTSGDGGVGTVYHNTSTFLGKQTEVDYEVVEVVPHQRFVLRGDAGSVQLRDTLTFASTPEGGTALTYRAEFHPHGASKLAEPVLPPALTVLGDKVAATMQECLERL